MAELNTPGPKSDSGKVRSKKHSTHVDMTAMCDLAFLLITFFILTTTLSKPQSMNLGMPDKTDKTAAPTKVSENRTITLLLGTHNQLVWYMGQGDAPIEGPEMTGYGKNGIRQVLLDRNHRILNQAPDPADGEEKKGLIVIIKPSDQTRYFNVVDALDEMAISQIKQYAIVDISPAEIDMLKQYGLYSEI